ncbi:succinate dehydrogenase, cytochrome b556 subunit [Sphingomonas quercus]|uniref:Succinate dehydrogenase cytochrome b556 subunit n=1 Tax=Sphingomonas quercus TaxID=2842451 RepID=A0ABS6BPP4_9SPHN|nr:succinate dehydrogenase, cytochrome b556 subunit [Sphingomonas quercus]MBU3079180.1 succinate dehydrogenase, cytochrome b556 subunit [Sphingomonas quercus]
MAGAKNRPLSPHLTIWKWGPHMLVSILHRATGTAMAIGGGVMFVWWLVAAASGKDAYARYVDLMTADQGHFSLAGLNLVPFIVLFGLSWSFFQHMSSGLRHFLMDTGAGFELATNRNWARMTLVASVLLTVLFWAIIWSKH